MANKKIERLVDSAKTFASRTFKEGTKSWTDSYTEKLAELIVKECADAADMAYDARCVYPGDYVGEQLGYGEEKGISAWRSEN